MEEINKSKIVSPFMPRLMHIANVKFAVSVFMQFDERTLEQAFDSKRKEFENRELCERARNSLLLVPEHLRDGLIKAVYGLKKTAHTWYSDNLYHLELTDRDCIYHWRCDGRIDGPKTAQSVVQNVNIDIDKKFLLACKYCMEENILNFWSQMEVSGETEDLELIANSMEHFWVSWIRDGSRVPWRQAAGDFLSDSGDIYFDSRISAFFPSLHPEKRRKFLMFLTATDNDDYLRCLYAVTKEEEHQVLQKLPWKLLVAYSNWPLQSLLVETAKKLSSYLSEDNFREFLTKFFEHKANCKDFDYRKLFGTLWEQSPVPFRNFAKRDPNISKTINLWLEEIKRKASGVLMRRTKKICRHRMK